MTDVTQGTPFPANAVNALFLQETYTKPSKKKVSFSIKREQVT